MQKTNVAFLCRFVIKYSYIFFERVRAIGFITIPRSINYGESKCLEAPVGDVDTTCSDANFSTHFICTDMSLICHWYIYFYGTRMHSYVTRVSSVCNGKLFGYVIRMYLYKFVGIHRIYVQKKSNIMYFTIKEIL